MKIFIRLFYLIAIFYNILQEGKTQDYSETQYEEATTRWYSQVYKSAVKNENLTQHLQNMEDKLNKLEQQILDLKSLINANPVEIVIQRRQDGSEDFFRTWEEYKQGFGNVAGEFFLGLEKIHKLTNTRPYQLLIVMEDWENQRRYAKYNNFVVDSEREKYKLTSVGAYSGTAGDSLTYHVSFKFTTKDHDNDGNPDDNCALQYKGGWWHNKCHVSNLNGLYINGSIPAAQWAQGVVWKEFKDYTYSLKFVEMILIRS